MDLDAFKEYLKRGGRSTNAALRAIEYVEQFERYLGDHGRILDEADPDDLESFVAMVEAEPNESAKLHLWGIAYYYDFLDDPIMVHVAATMRRERVEQTPFRLRQFRGIDLDDTDRLATAGIRTAAELLGAARTRADRAALARRTEVSPAALDELVRLADLARIPGVKGIRARLYFDAGIRSTGDLAGWDPTELLDLLRRFVADTAFDGIAPLPGEVRHAVETAQRLPSTIEW
jgi:hypothetical protein